MNSVILIGRLTADPEGKEDSYARFTLAVDRKFKKEATSCLSILRKVLRSQ